MKEKKEWIGPTGIRCDSFEEIEFWTWLLEARKIGLLDRYLYHPKSFELMPKMSVLDDGKERFLFHNCEYTCDFVFRATEDFKRIDRGGLFSANGTDYWIDVKGKFSIYNDDAKFSVIRKWMYAKFGIYINKVVPLEFFEKTFSPEKLRYKKNGEVRAAYLGCATSGEIYRRLHEQPELF